MNCTLLEDTYTQVTSKADDILRHGDIEFDVSHVQKWGNLFVLTSLEELFQVDHVEGSCPPAHKESGMRTQRGFFCSGLGPSRRLLTGLYQCLFAQVELDQLGLSMFISSRNDFHCFVLTSNWFQLGKSCLAGASI